jgi:thioredoxin 2
MLITCSHCQTKNRVPDERLAHDPSCGHCGKALLDGHPAELSDANFGAVVSGTELPVVVDFWAEWCGPCKMMAPQFKQAAALLKGQALLAKVDSDACPQSSVRHRIRSIPTMVMFKNGEEVRRVSGAMSAQQIAQWVTHG